MMLNAGLWAFAGKGGHQVVNFALIIILARLLTPEAFGVVAAAQMVLVLSQVVVTFGLGAALIQTDRLTRSMERAALTLMMGVLRDQTKQIAAAGFLRTDKEDRDHLLRRS